MRLRTLVPFALAVALSGCPEERADAKRPLPRDRLPPAMPIQPPPTSAPARSGAAGTEPAPRESGPVEDAPSAQPTPTPEPTPGAPTR